MKHKLFLKACLAACAAFCSVSMSLADILHHKEIGGVTWTYTVNDGEVGIGSGEYLANVIPRDLSADIFVPSEIDGLPVTKINAYAFYKCRSMRSITLPQSLKTIGHSAFYDCWVATYEITISEGVTLLESSAFYGADIHRIVIPNTVAQIGSSAFSGSDLESVFVPASVLEIESYAFNVDCPITVDSSNPSYSSDANGTLYNKDKTILFNCGPKNISSFIIPSSVNSIGERAFHSCRKLESITIPSTVTHIGSEAFLQCYGVKTVVIESTGAIIDGETFEKCEALVNLVISGSDTIVKSYAFKGCKNLETVTIGPGVKDIGSLAFLDCDKLRSINVDPSNPYYCSIDGVLYDKQATKLILLPKTRSSIVFPASIRTIGSHACSFNTNLTSVTIPATVTNIFDHAFTDDRNLATITIEAGAAPEGVRRLDEGAFHGCYALSSLMIGEGITYLDRYAFADSLALESVHIPSSVTFIGDYAFKGCTRLSRVSIGQGTRTISGLAFSDCSAFTTVSVDPNARSISVGTITGNSSTTRVNIGSQVEEIDPAAFGVCSSLAEIIVDANNPDFCSVDGVLYNKTCTTLVYWPPAKQPLSIPDTVAIIGAGAFVGCTWLENLLLPDVVISVETNAFAGCTGLTTVTIPSSVTNIGDNAFFSCSALRTICVYPGDIDRVKELFSRAGVSRSSLKFVELWESALSIAPGSLPPGVVGIDYTSKLTAEGGVSPYSWQVHTHEIRKYNEYRATTTFSSSSSSGVGKGWKDDDGCWAYSLPFVFPFYGKTYTNAYINSNGTLSFDGFFSDYGASLYTLTNHAMIAVMWADLNTSSGNIYVGTTANSVTFRWKGVYYKGNAVNFSVTLFVDGRIKLSYGSGNSKGGLVGISAGDGEHCRECSCSRAGSLSSALDVVLEESLTEVGGLPAGITLSEDGVLSGTPSGMSSNVVDVMVTDARGKKNHQELQLVIWDKLPDGAYAHVVDSNEWHYSVKDDFATIGVSPVEGAVAKTTTGALTLPAALCGSSVSGISAFAFADCDGLTSVTIPSSVAEIGDNAFYGCSGLTAIVVDAANPCYQSVGGLLLTKDGTVVVEGVNGDVTIPGGVASVRRSAFSGRGSLTSVSMPSSVTNVGSEAFRDCSALTNIVFAGNAPTVGKNAFTDVASGCTATVYDDTTGWGEGETWNGLRLVRRASPIPNLGAGATEARVAEVLGGLSDANLAAHITNGADYVAFRSWAESVKGADGAAAGLAAVKASSQAWLSYALGSETLIAAAPQEGDLKVDEFTSAEDGSFAFTVSVKDIAVGSDAAAENLKKVFGLEGGSSLEDMSSAGVDIEFGTPEDGKVKFTARPRDEGQKAFFMKVKMNR